MQLPGMGTIAKHRLVAAITPEYCCSNGYSLVITVPSLCMDGAEGLETSRALGALARRTQAVESARQPGGYFVPQAY